MVLRIVANRPDPALYTLPWHLPLEQWTEHVVPLPRGLSRHVVRIIRLGETIYAVKETNEPIAWREYHTLRNLQRIGLPSVIAHGVVSGREDENDRELPAVLVTRHLAFALPYRSLFSHGLRADNLGHVVDALVVLLVRLHLSDFYWGDVSLSNVLFRRDAGALTAYLVDAETGELHPELSQRLREYDVQVGVENVFAELMDLQAGDLMEGEVDPADVVEMIQDRYDSLWGELTGLEEFDSSQMWRIAQRVERLNELGFDVEELDVVTDWDGDKIQIQPRVVELGHHFREWRDLTGMDVEDGQARRLLNDMASWAAVTGIGGDEKLLIAARWLAEIYRPVLSLVPMDLRGKLEGPEIFHEILEHRWYLSQQRSAEVDLFDAARDYVAHVLPNRPDEALGTSGRDAGAKEVEELVSRIHAEDPAP